MAYFAIWLIICHVLSSLNGHNDLYQLHLPFFGLEVAFIGGGAYIWFDRKVRLTFTEQGLFSDERHLYWKNITQIDKVEKLRKGKHGKEYAIHQALMVRVDFDNEVRRVPIDDLDQSPDSVYETALRFLTHAQKHKKP